MADSDIPPHSLSVDVSEGECHCSTWNEKEIVLHNQHVAKLSRLDLENRFLQVYEDNIHLKRECNNLRDQLKRLGTKVYRLIESHKSNPNCPAGGFERQALTAGLLLTEQTHRIAVLEAENERWRAKVEAMRQQFLSYRNFSISQKPRNLKRQSSAKHDAHLEQEIERLKENLKKMDKTVKMLQSGGESDDASAVDVSGKGKNGNKLRTEQRRSSETDLEEQRVRVASDVELIKAKRQMVIQDQEISAVKEHAVLLEQELTSAKDALEGSNQDCEGLKEQVQKHIQKIAELQREIIDLRQYQQRVKDLSEQIRDLQLEKEELKAHAAQLLQLSTTAAGSSRFSDDAGSASGETLRQRIASLEASLISEKAERVAMEASFKEEQHQLIQLRIKNQEMTVQLEELEKRLQSEKISASTAKIHQKQVEEMRVVNQQLEAKYQTLEEMLKESRKPCSRCPQLEQELKESKEPCSRCVLLEKELQVAATSPIPRHDSSSSIKLSGGNGVADRQDELLVKVPEDSQFSTQSVQMSGRGDAPVRRYPTMEQSRAILGLAKRTSSSRSSMRTEVDLVISPRSEEGQGDHPRRNSSSHSPHKQVISDPSLASNTSIPSSSIPISTFLSMYHNNESLQGETSNNSYLYPTKFFNAKDQEHKVTDTVIDSSNEVRFLETSLELDKCREMLRVQFNLNKLYKKEIDNLAKDVTKRNMKNLIGKNKR